LKLFFGYRFVDLLEQNRHSGLALIGLDCLTLAFSFLTTVFPSEAFATFAPPMAVFALYLALLNWHW